MQKRKTFSDTLKEWRAACNTSQSLAALILDVPYGTYINWEQARNVPHPLVQSTLLKIIRARINNNNAVKTQT